MRGLPRGVVRVTVRSLLGHPLPVVAADVSSCFPLVAHRLGWYDVVTAEHLRREDVTEEVRRAPRRSPPSRPQPSTPRPVATSA